MIKFDKPVIDVGDGEIEMLQFLNKRRRIDSLALCDGASKAIKNRMDFQYLNL